MFDYTKISDACVKCGKCKSVCTIFQVNQDEATSPRGFIDLLGAYKRDELELDKTTKDIFDSCFLCTNCVESCPNDLPTDMIIEQIRSEAAKKYGIAWYKRLFFFLLRHRKVMDIAAKFGYVFQTCGIKIDERTKSAKTRFDLGLPLIKDRSLPYANKKSFLNSYPEIIKTENKKAHKIAIFIGCMANYSYTNIGDSLIKILKALNYEIMIPKKQKCCSAPAYFTGDFNSVDKLIKQNIEYFETFFDEIEAMIIPEATCSAMINIDWEHYLHDQPKWLERAKKLTPKIHMDTKWLDESTKLKELLKQKEIDEKIITYHDPCHARKMQGVYKEPRNLIRQNYKIEEMSDPNVCCGFGGVTMQSEKYHLAKKAGKIKADIINDTKADIVSAECSACRMQITDSLGRTDSNKVFKNPIELIGDKI
jgi:glycolate oxidase iron-sulfur subunit